MKPLLEEVNNLSQEISAQEKSTKQISNLSSFQASLVSETGVFINDSKHASGEESSSNTIYTVTKNAIEVSINNCDGTIGWNPNTISNALQDNTNYTENTGGLSSTEPNSHCLDFKNFRFNIPPNATIQGITVNLTRQSNYSGATFNDKTAQLLINGNPIGNNKATSSNWSFTTMTVPYGNNSDLWGTAITPQQLNAEGFGFRIQAKNNGSGNGRARIYYVDIEVTYELNYPDLTIGDRVWHDYNGDGQQDSGEPGIPGVKVDLYDNSNNLVNFTITDKDGLFAFDGTDGVTANTAYQLRISKSDMVATNYETTFTNATYGSISDEDDSDAMDNGTDFVIALTSSGAGTCNASYDFGFVPKIQTYYCNDTYPITEGFLDVSSIPATDNSSTSPGSFNLPFPGHDNVTLSYTKTAGTHKRSTSAFQTNYTSFFLDQGYPNADAHAFFIEPNQGEIEVTYTFSKPEGSFDFLLTDIDDLEKFYISAKDKNGEPVTNFSGWRVRSADQSIFEGSTSGNDSKAPDWNPLTGEITSTDVDLANDHRSFMSLTPNILLTEISIFFPSTGVSGMHTYTTLYSTPYPRGTENCTCENNITTVYADNCSGDATNGYTADWKIGINTANAPDPNISYQRNSEAILTHTLTGETDTLTIPNIPADGGIYDTLRVYFTNDITCGDTIILKRPEPCPPDVAGATAPAEVCQGLSNTEIGGTAFEDWNYDGVINQDNTVGVQGVRVDLYDDCGTVAQSTYTDSNGNYKFTGLIPATTYRVEFSLPTSVACWAKPTRAGADNGTTIQFVQSGNCASLGVAAPQDYCEENPRMAIACYENGTGVGNTNDGLVSFFYDASGLPVGYMTSEQPTPTSPGTAEVPQKDATIEEIGAVHGAAWQASQQRLFLSTLTKRYVAFKDAPSYVYAVEYNNGVASTPVGFDLQGISPANGGTTIDLGDVCRDATCANAIGNTGIADDYELPPLPTQQSIDLDGFSKVGITAFGDADLSEDGHTLFLVNLHQRAIISVDVSDETASLPGTVNQYLLDNLPGVPSCNNGTFRPWALAFEKGRGYLGGVCDAAISQDSSDLQAYILSFDPNQPESGFVTELNFSLNYNRENGQRGNVTSHLYWQPWARNWAELNTFTNGSDNNLMAPQPIIGDIVFNEKGDMTIGLMDRFAHQNGRGNLIAVSQTTQAFDTNAGGDLIQVCRVNNSWALEGTPDCPDNDDNIDNDPLSQLLQNDGATNNGEFFYEDYFTEDTTSTVLFTHAETSNGVLELLKGSGEVVSTHYDPLWGPPRIVNSQGIVFHSTYTGERTDAYQIVKSTGNDPQTFAKANGLGDLQTMCQAAPIEIGNYVWEDTDGDGIQDACEPPIVGIFVALYKRENGAIGFVDSVRTDANGQYYFRELDGTQDSLKTGVEYTITVGQLMQYNTTTQRLEFGGKDLTLTHANQGSNIEIDSDGIPYTTDPTANFVNYPSVTFIMGEPGCMNHSLDFGFRPSCEMTLNFTQNECNDNSTPAVETDDYITFTFEVSNTYAGNSNTFQIVLEGLVIAEGTYGTPETVDYADSGRTVRFKANNMDTYTFTIRDKDDNVCLEEVTSIATENCSVCPIQICLPVLTTKKLGGTG